MVLVVAYFFSFMQTKVHMALKTSLCILRLSKYRGMWDATACFVNYITMLCIYQITWCNSLKNRNVIHMSHQQENCRWCTGNRLNSEKWSPDIFLIKSEPNKLPQTLSIPLLWPCVGRWWKNKKKGFASVEKAEENPPSIALCVPEAWVMSKEKAKGKAERSDY